jgi:hypothetical protein
MTDLLAEATALLKTWQRGDDPLVWAHTDAFLSRANAQPAAPEPSADLVLDTLEKAVIAREAWRTRAEAAESQLAAVEAILAEHWRRPLATQKDINHAAIDVAVKVDNLFRPTEPGQGGKT